MATRFSSGASSLGVPIFMPFVPLFVRMQDSQSRCEASLTIHQRAIQVSEQLQIVTLGNYSTKQRN
jgi:hypothetical protein